MMAASPRYANSRVLLVDDQQEIHNDFAEMLRDVAAPDRVEGER